MRNPFRNSEHGRETTDNTVPTPGSSQLQPESEVGQPQTELDFIFIDHSREGILKFRQEIIESIKNKQVIMIELITPNKKSRMRVQAALNYITHNDLGHDELNTRLQAQTDFDLLENMLCRELVNSGVDILLVDVNEDSSAQYKVLSRNFEIMRESFVRYLQNFSSPTRLKQHMVDAMKYEAEDIRFRDELVVEQIQKTVTHKYYQGKRIAVIVGAAHTAQYLAMQSTPGVEVNKVYPESVSSKHQTYIPTYSDEVVANILNNKPDANTDELLNKALLEKTIIWLTSFDIHSITTKEFRELIDKLSSGEVTAILEQVCELGIYDEQERKQRADKYLLDILDNLQRQSTT